MKKLSNRKLRWIIREIRKGEQSVYQIARQQGVTPRHVRRIRRRYQDVQDYLVDKVKIQRCGRKQKALTKEEEMCIIETRREYPDLGAVAILLPMVMGFLRRKRS